MKLDPLKTLDWLLVFAVLPVVGFVIVVSPICGFIYYGMVPLITGAVVSRRGRIATGLADRRAGRIIVISATMVIIANVALDAAWTHQILPAFNPVIGGGRLVEWLGVLAMCAFVMLLVGAVVLLYGLRMDARERTSISPIV